MNILTLGIAHVRDEQASLSEILDKKYNIKTFFCSERFGSIIPTPGYEYNDIQLGNNIFRNLYRIISLVFKEKISCVQLFLHTNSYFLEFLYLIIIKILRLDYFLVCTGAEILYWENHNFFQKIIYKTIFKFSKKIVIKELYMKSYIQKFKLFNINKTIFIHNCVGKKIVDYKSLKCRDKKIILFFNSFKKWRNIDFLIDCANDICNKDNKIYFYIVGARNKEEFNKYIKLIKNDNIKLFLNTNNRFYFYSIADVFCLPADIVWLNNSVLETMAYEIPQLLPDVEGVRKIISDGKEGHIYKHNNKEDFIEKLFKILKDENNNMGKKAALNVSEKFNVEKRAEKYFSFLKEF